MTQDEILESAAAAEAEDSIPAWAQTVIAAHTSVAGANVSHAGRMKSSRYFVWQEDEDNELRGDNGCDETAVTGYTDLFTKREFDPWAYAIGDAFDAAGMSWHKTGTTYEQDTGFFHHTWEWEVVG